MAKEMEFNKREDTMRMLMSKLEQKTTKVYEGGGKKKIEAQHALGKLTARERIDYFWIRGPTGLR